MLTSRSRRGAGALVAVLAATFLLPLAAFARVPARGAGKHACHCPVKMACCEAGLCHADADEAPASSPSWSGCRDEAPDRDAVPPPVSAFDSALPSGGSHFAGRAFALARFVAVESAPARSPAPATPPPRASSRVR